MRMITQADIWYCYQYGVEKKIFAYSREDLYNLSRETLLTAVALGIDASVDHNRYDEHAHNSRGRTMLTTDLEEAVLKLGRGRIRIVFSPSGCVGKRAKLMLVDDCVANRDYVDECIAKAQAEINRAQFKKEYQCIWDVSIEDGDDISNDDANDLTVNIEELMCLIEEKHSDKE